MRRLQLFEFHEQSWFPALLREAVTDLLTLADRFSGISASLVEPFVRVLRLAGTDRVWDLCSGAGGPLVTLAGELEAQGLAVPRIILTDLFPHLSAWEHLRQNHGKWLDYRAEPLDATQLPAEVQGAVVTVFNALHHFPPELVREMVRSAVERSCTLFVIEVSPRSFRRGLPFLLHLTGALLAYPFVSRTRWLKKLGVLLLLPLLMLTGFWDWAVSTLRIYNPDELIALGREVAPHYDWQPGTVPFLPWGRATYVVGTPTRRV